MKISKKISRIVFSILFLSSPALIFQGCEKQPEKLKSVDLRYRVENKYCVAADGTEKITFQVKSSDPWTVFGNNPNADWYTITPSSGDDATKTYDVVITFNKNTELDDRCDTINIKSDYWTGKRFTITQKGIAFLTATNTEPIKQEGGKTKIKINSNQNWSAKVTEGEAWAKIISGQTGTQNGLIELDINYNQGEKRMATISIYDRHDVLAATAVCTQNGVILTPANPENGKFFMISKSEQDFEIDIDSNTKWQIKKENPELTDWITLLTPEGSGSGKIRVHLEKHTGFKVREERLIIQSKAVEGVTPVIKTIRLKQECEPNILTFRIGDVHPGADFNSEQFKEGQCNIYVNSIPTGANLKCYYVLDLADPYTEFRYYIINGHTDLSTTPWNDFIYTETSNSYSVNTDEPNVFSINIQNIQHENGIYPRIEWFCNRQPVTLNNGDDAKLDWIDDRFENKTLSGFIIIRSEGAPVNVTKLEYVPKIDWGE